MPKRRKIVSIKDVAKRAGVSLSTVSFAMNNPDRVAINTRRNVLRIARELEYSRVKKHGKRGYIGIVTDDYYNFLFGEFYNWVIFGILEELKARGINILVESTGKDPEYFPRMITKNLVDGVLFIGKSSLDLTYISQQKGIPILLVGHPMSEGELHTIVTDGRSGAFQAINHLIDLGHKKIALITGEPMYDPITAERVEGYRFALNKAGIEERKEYLIQADFGKPETAINATKQLLALSDPPTAIFCASDSLAYRAYQAITAQGLKIPQDISIVGFDDITAPDYAALPRPELTTVHVDRRMMGKKSVEILFDLIQNQAKAAYRYTLPVQLAIKGSTAKPHG
ncbi:MAG: LacI family DNA-binding transcriptional regulator [Candidatus Margulisiibacteriota bacterium]